MTAREMRRYHCNYIHLPCVLNLYVYICVVVTHVDWIDTADGSLLNTYIIPTGLASVSNAPHLCEHLLLLYRFLICLLEPITYLVYAPMGLLMYYHVQLTRSHIWMYIKSYVMHIASYMYITYLHQM